MTEEFEVQEVLEVEEEFEVLELTLQEDRHHEGRFIAFHPSDRGLIEFPFDKSGLETGMKVRVKVYFDRMSMSGK